jgi:gliding-associated putative ABC transporter substrate-binding component GldG
MKNNKLYVSIILVVAIIIVVNLISGLLSFRLDLTENKQYTLSDATKNILKELTEPVTVNVYFTEDLPPDIEKIRRDVKEMLVEYSNLSDGMLVYEFINPGESEEIEKKAVEDGVQPILINVTEKDQVKQQKAYLGAVVQLGENKEIIPVFDPSGSGMEYGFSTAIKKLSVVDKQTIGLLQGHGEPEISKIAQVYTELNILYNIETVTLSETAGVPETIKTLAIIRPTDSIPEYQFAQLDEFLASGGKLVVAINRVGGDFNNPYWEGVTTGLETWLEEKGLLVEENFVTDVNCGSVTYQQQFGNFVIPQSVQVYYLPILNTFADHTITKGLEGVIFQFASSLSYIGNSTNTFTPIAFTSKQSGKKQTPVTFNLNQNWTLADFPESNIPLAGILEGNIEGSTDAKIIIFTDGDFVIAEEQGQTINPDNVSLFVNSIDWLSDDTGLIELRTKGVISRPIDQTLTESKKSFLKWFNFLLPILLIVIYGIVRWQMNKNRKLKRQIERYS